MRGKPIAMAVAMLGLLASAGSALAQKTSIQAIEEYREMLQDGNPADLFEAKGEDLWKQKRGPKNASLERCDLGKGPGVPALRARVQPRLPRLRDRHPRAGRHRRRRHAGLRGRLRARLISRAGGSRRRRSAGPLR